MNYNYTDYIRNGVIRSVVDESMAHPQKRVEVVQDDQGRTWSVGGTAIGTESGGKTNLLERIRNAVLLFFKYWSSTFRNNFNQAIQKINQASQNIDEIEDSDDEELDISSEENDGFVLLSKAGCSEAKKTMTISEEALNELRGDDEKTNEFWDSILKSGAKRLRITLGEDDPVTYEKGFLKLLLENKPSIVDLTDMYTLQFNEGDMILPKAKLRLCGDYFESTFECETQENARKTFSFNNEMEVVGGALESGISQEGFRDILRAIETEESEFEDYPEAFKVAVDYLQFTPTIDIPEGLYGVDEWSIWGKIGEVTYPKELIKFLNEPCPISKSGKTAKETHTVVWMPPTVDEKPLDVNLLGSFSKYQYCWDKIKADHKMNEPIEKGYWVAMYTEGDPLDPDQGRAAHLDYIGRNCKGYALPKVREAVVCALLPYACSEKKVNIFDIQNVCFTRCEEMIDGNTLVVGALAPSGLYVNANLDADVSIGVCPVRKFF